MNEINLGKYKPKYPKRPNLSNEEKIALRKLQNNPNIVIKPADKGSAVVVTTDSILEAKNSSRY